MNVTILKQVDCFGTEVPAGITVLEGESIWDGLAREEEKLEKTKGKFNYAHFPVGTIFEVFLRHGSDKYQGYSTHTATGVVNNGPDSWCVITSSPGGVTEFLSMNVVFITRIIKRGDGSLVVGDTAYERERIAKEHKFIFDQARQGSVYFGHPKHPSQYFCAEPRALIYLLAQKYVTNDMLVDYDKLTRSLWDHGFIKTAMNEDLHHPWKVISGNKKKLNAAIKRVINKCLVKHGKAQKERDDQQAAEYYRDMDQDMDLLDRELSRSLKTVHKITHVDRPSYDLQYGYCEDGLCFRFIGNHPKEKTEMYKLAIKTFDGQGEFGISEEAFGFNEDSGVDLELPSHHALYAVGLDDNGAGSGPFFEHLAEVEKVYVPPSHPDIGYNDCDPTDDLMVSDSVLAENEILRLEAASELVGDGTGTALPEIKPV